MNTIKKISLLLFLLLIITSCEDDDAGQIIDNTPTTFEIIADSPDHTTLETFILENNLDEVLDSGIFTVFAPTDDAFASLNLAGLTDEDLTQILLNHVVVGNIESTDLSNGYVKTNAFENFTGNQNFLSMYVNVDNGVTLNGISSVTEADQEASNGVVHTVDEVITIPDVTTFATADDTFSTLVTALTRDDQPDFVSTLSSFNDPAPLTVFAPTNDAFSDLLAELGLSELSEIDAATLTSTLQTHVIPGSIIRANDFTTGTISTLGSDIDIEADTATITDQDGRNINIIATNIQAGNGVIHAVDTVILP